MIIISLISGALRIAGLISIISSFVLMSKVKKVVPDGQQVQTQLTSKERNYVLLMSVLSPLVTQAVFYYGWRKKLPVKATSANKLGWIGFVIAIILWLGLGFLTSFALVS